MQDNKHAQSFRSVSPTRLANGVLNAYSFLGSILEPLFIQAKYTTMETQKEKNNGGNCGYTITDPNNKDYAESSVRSPGHVSP